MKHRSLSVITVSAITLLSIPASAALRGGVTSYAILLPSGLAAHGYLGVDVRDVADDQVSILKLKDAHGAEIIRVDHDGPAGNAGLREHDVILQMNGQAIDASEQLRRLLRATASGQSITFQISRDGQLQTISAQLENREEVERRAMARITVPDAGLGTPSSGQSAPPPPTQGSSAGAELRAGNSFLSPGPTGGGSHAERSLLGGMALRSGYTGAVLETMSPQLARYFGTSTGSGLLVRSVDANSPAESAGLHAGDVVLRINATSVNSTADWLKAMRDAKGKAISVVVLRDKHEQTVSLTPDAHRRSSLQPIFPSSVIDPTQIYSLVASLRDENGGVLQGYDVAGLDVAALADKVRALVNSPEFDKQMEELRSKLNSDAFTQQLNSDAMRQQLEAVRSRVNSPDFQKQIEELRSKLGSGLLPEQLNSSEFKRQMDELHSKLDSEAWRQQFNKLQVDSSSPEFKKQMDDLRKQIDQLREELLSK